MKRWLALLVVSFIVGVIGIVLQQAAIATIGFGLAVVALLLFARALAPVMHSIRKVDPSVESKGPIRRSVTAALHAAIFSSSTDEE